MTVCSSIVILEALGARPLVPRREMAEVAIESERYVGVASGGMDQSASIFGEPDSVSRGARGRKYTRCADDGRARATQTGPSHHLPPTTSNLARLDASQRPRVSNASLLPSPPLLPLTHSHPSPAHRCTFLIANSLVVSDKKVNGPIQYNLRVVELLIAARIFCLNQGIPLPDSGPEATPTWRKVMELYFQKNPLDVKDEEVKKLLEKYGEEAAQLHVLGQLVETTLPTGGAIPLEEAQRLTGFPSAQAFSSAFLQRFDVRTEQGFECLKRTRHVFAEAKRVWEFKALLQGEGKKDGLYEELGELMNQSHESLAR